MYVYEGDLVLIKKLESKMYGKVVEAKFVYGATNEEIWIIAENEIYYIGEFEMYEEISYEHTKNKTKEILKEKTDEEILEELKSDENKLIQSIKNIRKILLEE